MLTEEKKKVIKTISELNDVIARCKYSIREANIILKSIKDEYTNISFPIPHIRVIEEVKKEFGIDFVVKSQKRHIIDARHTCIYLLKKFTDLTLKEIAEYVGVRDHTTVINALKTASNLITTDIEFRARANKIEKQLWEIHNEIYGNNLQEV